MPITTRWYDEGETIRHWIFEGQWNWTEFYEAVEESQKAVSAKPYRVDTILDLNSLRVNLPNIVSNFRAASARRAPNVRLFVIVGGSFVRTLLNVVKTLLGESGQNARFAPTLEDALAIIAQVREKEAADANARGSQPLP